MKLLIGLFTLAAMTSVQASELRLQKVKTIGHFNHKVIFQSTDVKHVKKSKIVKGKIVAMWGLHVYEVANAYYGCNQKNFCRLLEVETVAMYESCSVKNKKAVCTGKISGESSVSNSRDFATSENPDAVGSEFGERDLNGEYESEFPVRITDEFSDLF